MTILGERLDLLSANRRDEFRADRIGFVFQQFNLVPYLSVVDNVLLPCRFLAPRLARVSGAANEARRLLEAMDLPVDDLTRRPVADLSVGQQQRVAVARALIGRPDLIITDEPTSSLDEEARRAFLDLLFAEVQSSGQTLIFVSHDRRLADAFDRTMALADVNRASVLEAA